MKKQPPSWIDKLHCPKTNTPTPPKLLESAVVGMPAGALMYISTPLEIAEYIQKIPYGKSVSIAKMRDDLAHKNHADCTCPLTTGIFLKIVAEAAFEKINQGDISCVTPFWRVIDLNATIAKKLSFGVAFLKQKRNEENIF